MDTDISAVELLNSGMAALKDSLGIVNAERFILLVLSEKNDYTKWRRKYFENMTDEEIRTAAIEYDKNNPYMGNAKIIL